MNWTVLLICFVEFYMYRWVQYNNKTLNYKKHIYWILYKKGVKNAKDYLYIRAEYVPMQQPLKNLQKTVQGHHTV